MPRSFRLFICCLFITASSTLVTAGEPVICTPAATEPASIYDFTMTTIDGGKRPLSEYKGKVLLIVNTASRCGFTPQYEGLQRVFDQYKDKGFMVLGFPANDFMGQEPGTNEEIKTFCSTKYSVTFDLFSKIHVAGDDKDPLFEFLTTKSPKPGNISWNFNKFLIARDGTIVERWGSKEKPESIDIAKAIEAQLAKDVSTGKEAETK